MDTLQLNFQLINNKIEEAFSHIFCPQEKELLHPSYHSSHFWEIEDFQGKNWESWQDIPYEILENNYSGLSFFSPEAFSFFLPAYLTQALAHPSGNLLIFTIYNLTKRDDPEINFIFLSQVSQLTKQQKQAVIYFLEFVRDTPEYFAFKEANEALQSYWLK